MTTPAKAQRFKWSSLLGFDVFICYRQGHASPYAKALLRNLTGAGLVCFLDQEETPGGVVLSPAIAGALKASRMLVVIASPGFLQSKWVQQELGTFRRMTRKPIIPISVDGVLRTDDPEPTIQHLQSLTWLDESAEAFDGAAPSDAVVEGIERSRSRIRINTISRGITAAVIAILATSLAVAIWQWREAATQRDEANVQRATAVSRALAAQAANLQHSNVPLALLLSVEAMRSALTVEARSVLLDSLLQAPHYGMRREKAALAVSLAARGATPLVMGRLGTRAEVTATRCTPGEFRVWQVETGEPLGQPVGDYECQVTNAAISRDGRTLAVATCEVPSEGSRDRGCRGSIRVFDVATGNALGTPMQQEGWSERLAFSPDGRTLASCNCRKRDPASNSCLERRVRVWKVGSDRFTEPRITLYGPASAFAISADGRVLALGGARLVALWDAASAQPLGDLTVAAESTSLSFSPDSRALAIAEGDLQISIWSVETRAAARDPLPIDSAAMSSVLFAANDRLLASRSNDGTVRVWQLPSGEAPVDVAAPTHLLAMMLAGHQRPLPGPRLVSSAAFSPDGSFLASGAADGAVTIWDAVSGARRTALRARESSIEALAFSPDGKTLATGSMTGTIQLWSASTYAPLHRFAEWDPAERRRFGKSLVGYRNYVRALAFNTDGRFLASGDSGGALLLWDLADKKLQRRVQHNDPVDGVVFTPDGKAMMWVSRDSLNVADVELTQKSERFPLPVSGVRRVALSGDGRILAMADRGGRIVLWDVRKRRVLRQLLAHGEAVEGLAISAAGDVLASGSTDDTVRLWDVATGEAIGAPLSDGGGSVYAVAMSSDGKRAASGHIDGTLRLWNINVDSWKTLACRLANRNMTEVEWKAHFRDDVYRQTCPR